MPDTKNPLKRVDVRAAPEPVSTGLACQTPDSFGGAPSDAAACLRPLRALISDLDGTLLAGNRAQPDLQRFLDCLRKRGIALTVVTNNTVRTPAQYSQKLATAGANVPPEQILTAAIATAAYLQAELPPASPIFVVGESGLRAALVEAGFVLLEDSAVPAAAVVVGGDRTVSHDKLKHAIRHVRRGARFIGTNPDLLVPVEDGLAPEAGVLLAAIAAGAGVARRSSANLSGLCLSRRCG